LHGDLVRSFSIITRDEGFKLASKENVFYGHPVSLANENIKIQERAVIAINLFRACG
jgi:hypothetical protein